MGLFGKLGRLVMDVVEIPVAAVKDTITLGGVLDDKKEPYTVSKLKDIGKDYNAIKNEIDKD